MGEDDEEQFIDIEEPAAAAPSMMELEMNSNKTFRNSSTTSTNTMTRRNSGSLFSQEGTSQKEELVGASTTKSDDDVDEETKRRNEKKFHDLERERMNKEYYDKRVRAATETLASPAESLTPPSLQPPPITTEKTTLETFDIA